MPLNNSINKNSDTFFATSNITANFTSPVLTTVVSATTYTNRISGVLQSTNESILTSEYYNNGTGTNTGSILYFTRALGTKAAPLNLTATQVPAMTMRFARYLSGAFADNGYIRAYVDNTNFTNFVLNSGSNLFFRSTGFVYTNQQFFACDDSNINETSPGSFLNGLFSIDGIGNDFRGIFAKFTGFNNSKNILATTNSNTVDQPASIVIARARGVSISNATPIQANDPIGEIRFAGFLGFTYRSAALIRVENDGSTSGAPGRMIFFTTPIGTNTLAESMRIDNAGRITQIRQPSFSASLSADVANATGDGTAYTVAFDTEQYDQGSNFSANTFTAPIAGRYRFAYTISVDDLLVGHTKLELTIGGRVVERCNPYAIADSDGFCLLSGMVDLSLAASATVTMVVTVSGSTKTVTVKGTTTSGTFLSGQLQV